MSRTKYSASTFAAFHCTVIGNAFQHLGYPTQGVAGLCQGTGEGLECVRSPSTSREQLDTLNRTRNSREGCCDLLLVFVIRWEHKVEKPNRDNLCFHLDAAIRKMSNFKRLIGHLLILFLLVSC